MPSCWSLPRVPARPPRASPVRTTLASATLLAIVAGCSTGATPVPTPADAGQLVAAAAASLDGVRQLDAHLTLSGTLTPPADGAAAAPSPVTLDGTVAELRTDAATGSVDLTVTLPAAVGGGSAEAIVIGSDVYLKFGSLGASMGLADDGMFHHTTTGTLAGLGGLTGLPMASATANASAAPSELAAQLDQLRTYLASLAQPPTIASVTCGASQCWDLHVTLGASDLATLAARGTSALASALPFVAPSAAVPSSLRSVTFDLLVRQSDSRPAELKASIDAGSTGTAAADLTLVLDQPQAISAPPAGQVVEGLPSFDLP